MIQLLCTVHPLLFLSLPTCLLYFTILAHKRSVRPSIIRFLVRRWVVHGPLIERHLVQDCHIVIKVMEFWVFWQQTVMISLQKIGLLHWNSLFSLIEKWHHTLILFHCNGPTSLFVLCVAYKPLLIKQNECIQYVYKKWWAWLNSMRHPLLQHQIMCTFVFEWFIIKKHTGISCQNLFHSTIIPP